MHNPFQSKSIIKAHHTPDGAPRHYTTLFTHGFLYVFYRLFSSAENLDQFLYPGVFPGLETDETIQCTCEPGGEEAGAGDIILGHGLATL
jgi:hypothetical protein